MTDYDFSQCHESELSENDWDALSWRTKDSQSVAQASVHDWSEMPTDVT